MFERVDLEHAQALPPKNTHKASGASLPVENQDEQVPVTVAKGATAQPMEVSAPPPQKADLKKIPGRRRLWLIPTIIAGVLVLGLGGVFAAYRQGYIDIPFLNPIFLSDDALASSISALSKIESGHVTATVRIAVEPKTDAAVALSSESKDDVFTPQRAAQAARLKSDLAQYRTALSLYADDNDFAFPEQLSELVPTYLASSLEPLNTTMRYSYEPSADRKAYSLVGTMTLGSTVYTFSLDEQGKAIDTFPEATPTSILDSFGGFGEFLDAALPSDLQLEATIDSVTGKQKDAGTIPDSDVSIAASYAGSGLQLALDADMRMKNGKPYVRINSFPGDLFVDMSPVLGQWIDADIEKLAGSTGSGVSLFLGLPDPTSIAGAGMTKESREFFTSFLSQAVAKDFVSIERKLSPERIDGKLFDVYTLKSKAEQLDETIVAVMADMKEYCAVQECTTLTDIPNEQDVRDMITTLIGPETEMVSRIINGGAYTLWVGRDGDSFRLMTDVAFSFTDATLKLKDKQIRVTIDLLISEINKDASIDTPTDPISSEEVERLLGGYSEEEWNFKKQSSVVSSTRTALNSYYNSNGAYPETLDLIVDDASDDDAAMAPVKVAQLDFDTGSFLPSTMRPSGGVVSEKPVDVFTGKEMTYETADNNYTLTYTMVLPIDSTKISDVDREQFVQGKNTADKYVVSREAIWNTDSDNDGLSGKEEYDHGTNPVKRDTDNDGASDFTEIQEGTDPLDHTSKPAATSSTQPIIITPSATAGSLNPNTGSLNGGSVVTIGFSGAKSDAAVYFGLRRAYVKSVGEDSIKVVLPGYESTLVSSERAVVTVKVISEGRDHVMDSFTYTGGTKKDTDGDGLPDAEEAAIGTSSTLTDSDQDGYTDFVEVNSGHDPLYAPLSDVTIEEQANTTLFNGTEGTLHFWAKTDDWEKTTYMNMVNLVDGAGNERLLIREGVTYFGFILYESNTDSFSTWTANDVGWENNEWMHFAVTWKQGEAPLLYANGVQLQGMSSEQQANVIDTSELSALSSSGTLYLNGRASQDGLGNVEVDDFTTLNAVLTAAEIQTVYENGK